MSKKRDRQSEEAASKAHCVLLEEAGAEEGSDPAQRAERALVDRLSVFHGKTAEDLELAARLVDNCRAVAERERSRGRLPQAKAQAFQ